MTWRVFVLYIYYTEDIDTTNPLCNATLVIRIKELVLYKYYLAPNFIVLPIHQQCHVHPAAPAIYIHRISILYTSD